MQEETRLKKQKRVLAIHDISCLGRCSLTVALPIISAAGIECTVLPTAVLSTHTGGFSGFTFRDLTGDLWDILNHWETLGITFDGIYTGYLGSFEQLDVVSNIIKRYRSPDCKVIVDPVLGDAGVFYQKFDQRFARGMADLCRQADVIVPNMTEAAFLLEETYRPDADAFYAKQILQRLHDAFSAKVVLTGFSDGRGGLGAGTFDGQKTFHTVLPRIEGIYHGTGDVFASALTAAYVLGHSLEAAADIAVRYTYSAIEIAYERKIEARMGVPFEERLPYLLRLLGIDGR